MKDRHKFGNIIGKSPAIQQTYELILKACTCDANVVIYGESGTGKELVARTIHDMGARGDKGFVAVNCGAIPEALFESEFFGYRKGAFTGAYADKHGFFDLARGGTLFLDEVGELNPNMQVKLLRAIDGGGYTPVGDNKLRNTDFRIVAATNRALVDMVNNRLIREDFLYRIHVIPITVPPLRDRKEDVPLLVDHFLRLHGNRKGRQSIPGNILDVLYNHDWPGNVRELENVLRRYLTIKRLDFINAPTSQTIDIGNISGTQLHQQGLVLREAVEAFEKEFISKVLEQNHWHRAKSAAMLGIPPRTLHRKIKKLRLV
jgi:transcriptional regulator with PAS, ATPase and Fis domain